MIQSQVDVNNVILKPMFIDKTNLVDDSSADITEGSSSLSPDFNSTAFNNILKDYDVVDDDTILHYSEELLNELNESLQLNSSLSMLPNFNINPTGKEHGNYLIIDLGGSTLRISIIEIQPESSNINRSERINIIIENKWIMANNEKTIDDEFFKFIGSKMIETINQQSNISIDDTINVGITWSFPLNQTSHNSGKINNVGKGWIISEEIYNQDLKDILENSLLNNFNCKINVKVIINDSLAVYAAGRFLSSDLKLAMVLGTGYNICCSLKTSKLHPLKSLNSDAILLNSETSLFGSMLAPLSNEFDLEIDDRFLKGKSFKAYMELDDNTKIFQPYEIMTSGRYLPELTRLSILKLMKNNEIFSDLLIHPTNKIFTVYDGFSSEILCVFSENNSTLNEIKDQFIKEFGDDFKDITLHDLMKIQQLVNSIIKRASFIVTISIISFIKLLIDHNNETFPNKKLTIGYVGSILVYFNRYRNMILEMINDCDYIRNLGITVDLMSIDDSSIVGAAIGAAYYT
ncbi:N-acetylglucosamine kinase 1 [[Candida] jaroonii]|uniref:N-acetylglucosamine kinase 1 n=1 Tax=[Candida] jaroonii TaxID=467808 RepID=A0ACA9Y850_9ASCO|nr:N-acetylglucosamine kinase 1 [[Candida] jaroonii]